MDINLGHIVAWLLVGFFAGSLIGRLAKGSKSGFGFWKNTLLGCTGAIVGGFLFTILGVDFGLSDLTISFNDIVSALIGTLLVLGILWFRGRGKKPAAGGDSA